MGPLCCSISSPPVFLLVGSLHSSSSSPLSVSESSSCSSVNQNSRSSAAAVGPATRKTSEFELWPRCRIWRTRLSIDCKSSEGDLRMSQLESPHKEKTGLWNGVSTIRITSLATALLANTVCGNALAGVEPSPVVSNENSNFMFLVICIGEAIALTGAAVGGILARQRKVELEKINAQLRQINVNLRRQSRVESYAPNLTYAPVGSGRTPEFQVRSDPVRDELMQALKTGKRWLREQSPANAYGEFQRALVLAQQLNDTAEEKKAARGLGASCQRQGMYKEAIKHHLLVLSVSKQIGESSGDTEAYGAIADCYTELGDLETAGRYYDRYIERLETDDTT